MRGRKIAQQLRIASVMQCTTCGASADATCDCGVAYVPAGKRAEAAVAANPGMSVRAISERTGIPKSTISAVRSRVQDGTPEKVVGRDGIAQAAKKKKKPKLTLVSVNPTEAVGAFFYELEKTLNDYCARLEAFVESHPDLNDECRGGLVQVLEVNSMRLQNLAQQIDNRENDDV